MRGQRVLRQRGISGTDNRGAPALATPGSERAEGRGPSLGLSTPQGRKNQPSLPGWWQLEVSPAGRAARVGVRRLPASGLAHAAWPPLSLA